MLGKEICSTVQAIERELFKYKLVWFVISTTLNLTVDLLWVQVHSHLGIWQVSCYFGSSEDRNCLLQEISSSLSHHIRL